MSKKIKSKKIRKVSPQGKYMLQRLKELEESRDLWKDKYFELNNILSLKEEDVKKKEDKI